MNTQQRPEPKLQILLIQLARFFKENETILSAEQVSESLGHFSATERSALDRLFALLYQSKTPDLDYSAERSNILRLGDVNVGLFGRQLDTPPIFRALSQQNVVSARSIEDRPSYTGNAQEHQTFGTSQPTYSHQPEVYAGTCSSHIAARTQAPTQVDFNDQSTSFMSLAQNPALSPPPSPNSTATLPAQGPILSHQEEAVALSVGVGDFSFSKTTLTTCSEIKLTPSTKQLLEKCKTDRSEFLRAIREAKAAFPTGQGWEAAIATKRENADIRDLMRIYHRFECYNIYVHVVEAGFHTGTHWIRDMRAVLIKRLCNEFPERFCDAKTANKSLNWVDQGCRYHEWTRTFSETPDLGYLIALPSDVSHSAYTSRCTKDQMSTAALKFKLGGIDDLVRDLELAQLGNHIATALREMTGKKRKDVGESSKITALDSTAEYTDIRFTLRSEYYATRVNGIWY
ncbi:hypothetical protein PENANT_c006G05563 [Penicillium antarcticum]|uniref:Uncharacterized protein n=2 Tax=Penicillium antarcticum TaxID=416450 RepID=A0A1V6QDP4_9EURO|nr:hypothetical protein PENANT_c006G05563 [Penicillium antarcticum]